MFQFLSDVKVYIFGPIEDSTLGNYYGHFFTPFKHFVDHVINQEIINRLTENENNRRNLYVSVVFSMMLNIWCFWFCGSFFGKFTKICWTSNLKLVFSFSKYFRGSLDS